MFIAHMKLVSPPSLTYRELRNNAYKFMDPQFNPLRLKFVS